MTNTYLEWREPEGKRDLILHTDGTPLVGPMRDLMGCHYPANYKVVDDCDFNSHLDVGDWGKFFQPDFKGKRQHQPFHMWSIPALGSCVDV